MKPESENADCRAQPAEAGSEAAAGLLPTADVRPEPSPAAERRRPHPAGTKKTGGILGKLRSLLIDNLLGQSALFMLAVMLPKTMGVVLMPIRTRFLGPEDFGVLGAVTSINRLLIPIAGLGLAGAVTTYYRDYISEEGRFARFFGSCWTMLTGSGVVFVCLLLFAGPHVWEIFRIGDSYRVYPNMVYAAIPLFITTALTGVAQALFRATRRAQLFAIVSLSTWGCGIACSIPLLFIGWGVEGQLLGTAVGSVLGGVFALWFLLRDRNRLDWDRAEAKRALKFGVPLIPHMLTFWAMASANGLILARYASLEAAGFFSVAMGLSTVILVGINSLTQAWAPRAYQFLAEDDRAEKILSVYFRAWITVFGTATLLAVLAGPLVLKVLASPKFAPASPYLGMLMVAGFFQGIYQFGVIILYHHKRTGVIPMLSSSVAILAVGTSIWAVSRFGGIAATWCTLGANMLMAILFHIASQRIRPIDYHWWRTGLWLFAVLAASGWLALHPVGEITLLLQIAAAILAAAVLGWLLLVGKEYQLLKTAVFT